jgi:hypothetical protein
MAEQKRESVPYAIQDIRKIDKQVKTSSLETSCIELFLEFPPTAHQGVPQGCCLRITSFCDTPSTAKKKENCQPKTALLLCTFPTTRQRVSQDCCCLHNISVNNHMTSTRINLHKDGIGCCDGYGIDRTMPAILNGPMRQQEWKTFVSKSTIILYH